MIRELLHQLSVDVRPVFAVFIHVDTHCGDGRRRQQRAGEEPRSRLGWTRPYPCTPRLSRCRGWCLWRRGWSSVSSLGVKRTPPPEAASAAASSRPQADKAHVVNGMFQLILPPSFSCSTSPCSWAWVPSSCEVWGPAEPPSQVWQGSVMLHLPQPPPPPPPPPSTKR